MSTGPTTGRHTLPARWLAQALAVAMLLLVAGCGGDSVGDTTTLTADNATAAVTPTSAAVTTTTAAVAVAGLVWSRVQHDEAIFADPRGQQGMLSVTAGGPGLVAVGWDESGGDGDAAVWTSRDGLSWSRLPHDESIFGGPGRQVVYSVVVGGPGLVAVGSDCSGGDWGDCDAAVWTSRDGLIWSRVPHDGAVLGGPGWQQMLSVMAWGPGLVAVGSGGDWDAAVWTSRDGLSWSRVPHDEAIFGGPEDQGMYSVTAGGPGLVAVGWDGSGGDWDAAVWTSRDGLIWSRVPHDGAVLGGPDWQDMHSVTAGGPGLVAVGSDCSGGDWGDCDAAVWTSRDGLIWSRVPHDGAVLGGPGWQLMFSVTVGGPGLVAVGRAVWTSADGLIWSRVPHDEGVPGGGTMLEVTAGGPGLVAVGWEGETYEGDTDAAVWVSPPPG